MSTTPLSSLPLEQLFAQLQAAGFRMDTRRKLRLWRAVREKGGEYVGRIDELKYLLAPLVATNGVEQRRFYALWGAFLAECVHEVEATQPETPFLPPPETRWAPGAMFWVASLLVLGLLIGGLYRRTRPEVAYPATDFEVPLINFMAPAREGDTLRFRNVSPPGGVGLDSLRWEIVDRASGVLEKTDTSRNLVWVAGRHGSDKTITLRASVKNQSSSIQLHIHCAEPPKIDTVFWPAGPLTQNKDYVFRAEAAPNARVFWVLNGDTLPGARVTHRFSDNGQPRAECYAVDPANAADCYDVEAKTLVIGSDKPFLNLAELTYDEPRVFRQLASWLWALLLLPLLASAWLLYRWWKKRREKPAAKSDAELAAQYPVHDRAPYFIPYRPQDHKIGALAPFFRMAEVLNRREDDERRAFDAPASVEATIAGGGFPAWRERAQTSPPDFLFLVTRATERDQLGRLFERLTSFLKKQDAPLAVFFHDGSFERFRNEEHAEGVSLGWLAQHFPEYQLVLLGDAHGLLNPYDTRRPVLRAEAKTLLRWRKRLLLTPAPVAGWSYQEALLHCYFLLYPADTDGLLDGFEALDALDEYEPGPYTPWETQAGRLRADRSDRYHSWETAAEHRDFLQNDPDAFRWLCGLAVTTQPDYALTLAIGHALGIEVTHDRLLRLARIPWLSANEPPNRLRLDLLAQLSPDDERLARQAAADELEAVREQAAGSFAETDWRVNLAIHHFALDPRDEAHKQTIRELRHLGLLSGAQEAELDWVVRERADGTGLPAGSTASLDAWLDAPPSKPFWTGELGLALLGLAMTAGLAFAGWDYNRQQPDQIRATAEPLKVWQQEKMVEDEALQIHNRAVGIARRLADTKNYGAWMSHQDSAMLADGFFKQAAGLRNDNYLLAGKNRLSFRYNMAAQGLNFFLQDSADIFSLSKAIEWTPFFLLPDRSTSPVALQWQHCEGLCYYYGWKEGVTNQFSHADAEINRMGPGSALNAYGQILRLSDSTYFDSLRLTMPINLESLLAVDGLIGRPKYALRVFVCDSLTKKGLPDATLQARSLPTLRSDRQGRIAYEFKNDPPTGQLYLTVRATGYQDWAGSVRPRSDGRTDTILMSKIAPAPPADRDADGVPDARDQCPDQFGPADNQGCPVQQVALDTDGDGIADADDQCPNQPGSALYKGCPTPADPVERLKVEPPTEALIREALQGFPFDKTGRANTTEREKIINYIDASIDGNIILQEEKGQVYYTRATFVSGSAIALSLGSKEKNDRYGAFILLPDGSSPQSFEIIKPSEQLPLPTMISIPGGTLTLGCTDKRDKGCQDNEKPAYDVTLSDFALSRTEVTNEQYAAFLNDYGSTKVKTGEYAGQEMIEVHAWGIKFPDPKSPGLYEPQRGYENHPVVYVSWYGAHEYCRWLSERTGQRYRLPTEAEWEYAARGGQKADPKQPFKYAGSNNLDEVGWYLDNSGSQTHPVAQKKANALGLYDMSGNLWEWCADWYGEKYYETLAKGARNPTGPASGTARVLRGGSWYDLDYDCSVRRRDYDGSPRGRYLIYGFRLAQDK